MNRPKRKWSKARFCPLVKRRNLVSKLLVILLALAFQGQPIGRAQTSAFDLTQALAQARDGDTIVIPPGEYHGPLTINKSVALVGTDWPIIDGRGQGDVLTVTAPDVTIEGLVVRNSGDSLNDENAGITGLAPRITVRGNRLENVLFGVYLKEAPGSVVRDNIIGGKDLNVARRGDAIRLWYCAGSLIEGNHASHGRDVVIWFSPNSTIRRNVVEYGRYGLHFMYSDDEIVEENVLRYNSVGLLERLCWLRRRWRRGRRRTLPIAEHL
jgi:nitrous oxidase accessory protein